MSRFPSAVEAADVVSLHAHRALRDRELPPVDEARVSSVPGSSAAVSSAAVSSAAVSSPPRPSRTQPSQPSQRPLRPSALGRAAPRPGLRPWPRIAITLVLLVAALTVFGLVFILSASSVESINRDGSYLTIFAKQVWWEALGLAGLLVTQRLGVRAVERFWFLGWLACIASLVAVAVAGVERNGSRRWFSAGGFDIQPSEMAKFAMVVSMAHLLTLRRRNVSARATLVPLALFAGPLLGLVVLQPDLGTTIVIAVAGMAVLMAGGLKWKYIGIICVLGFAAMAISVSTNTYQRDRIMAFTDIKSEPAYHIRESVESIQSGGLTGVGVGAGRSKYGYIPNSHTDFIFSVISEEMGLLGATVVVGLFAALSCVGTIIALRATDAFSRLIAFGVTAWISMQALANVAAVTAMAPVTGIPLPFISQGGTSFVTLMLAAGVLLDIARRGIDPTQVARDDHFDARVHPSQRVRSRG
jgi:cell division protein FtsW